MLDGTTVDPKTKEELKNIDVAALIAFITEQNVGSRFICPFHNDVNPSLTVDPIKNRWTCMVCGFKYRDSIQFVMEWLKKKNEKHWFRDAVRWMERNCVDIPAFDQSMNFSKTSKTHNSTRKPKTNDDPLEPLPDVLQPELFELIETFNRYLFTWVGQAARRWLNERGIQDSTLKRFRVGYNDVSRRTKSGLWIPNGIYMPNVHHGAVWNIKVRAEFLNGKKSYRAIGSSDMLWPSDNHTMVLVESELDYLLTSQELGSYVGIATFGTSSTKPSWKQIEPYFRNCKIALLALDNDPKGNDLTEHLLSLDPRFKRSIPHVGKDWKDFHKLHGDYIHWLLRNMEYLQTGNVPFYLND